MENSSINEKILDLWEKYSNKNEKDKYVPLLFNPFKKDCILFIGINPGSSNIGDKPYFKWKNKKSINLEKILIHEKQAREKYPYFKRFKEISKNVGVDWEHIDLFFNRKTSQEEFKKHIFIKNKLSKFAQEQLKIALEMIELINPRVIVVANALASNLIRNYEIEGLEKEINEEHGYHFLKLGNKNIPIFFSSMLTGQRALDKGSLERLEWHIKQALNESK